MAVSFASLLLLGCVQQVKLGDANHDDADLFGGKVVVMLPLAVSRELERRARPLARAGWAARDERGISAAELGARW